MHRSGQEPSGRERRGRAQPAAAASEAPAVMVMIDSHGGTQSITVCPSLIVGHRACRPTSDATRSGMMPGVPAHHDPELLSHVPLFRGLEDAALAQVAAHARRARAAAGRTFFREENVPVSSTCCVRPCEVRASVPAVGAAGRKAGRRGSRDRCSAFAGGSGPDDRHDAVHGQPNVERLGTRWPDCRRSAAGHRPQAAPSTAGRRRPPRVGLCAGATTLNGTASTARR